MQPSIYALIVLAIALLASRSGVLKLQVVACLFGGTAAINMPALGGACIVVPAFCVPFLVASAWREAYGSGAWRRVAPASAWLIAAVTCGLLVTFYVPRMLEGQIEILTLDRGGAQTGTRLMPLHPVSGNLTQSLYALGNVATFVSARTLLRGESRIAVYRDAVILLAQLTALSAIINLGEFYLGFPKVLEYVRTAYAVYESGEARGTGLMRIHGTFPETSAFCAFSMPLFAFTLSLWLNRVLPRRTGSVAALLFVFLALSTSGTAYAGMLIYGALLGVSVVRRARIEGQLPRSAGIVTGLLSVLFVVGVLIVFETSIAAKVGEFFDVTLFGKMDSDSGRERAAWNAQAWQNLLDTYGVGVGIGSARASSFALLLLSNMGVVGATCYLMFLWHAMRAIPVAPKTVGDTVAEASRQAVLASLSAAALSGASFDRGADFYIYAAAASSAADAVRVLASRATRLKATTVRAHA